MKITIKNLGKVEEVCIDLAKKLNIFTGENNSGKTLVSYVIFGLYRIKSLKLLAQPEINSVNHYNDGAEASVEINMYDFAFDNQKFIEESLIFSLSNNLSEIFNNNRSIYENCKIDIKLDSHFLREKVRNFEIESTFIAEDIDGNVLDFSVKSEKNNENIVLITDSDAEISILDQVAISSLASFLKKAIFSNCIFIPAERQGLLLLGKEVILNRSKFSEAFYTDDHLSISTKRIEKEFYSQPIGDILNLIRDIISGLPSKGKFVNLERVIQETILNGEVNVNDSGGFKFTPDGSTAEIDLLYSSSTVKSLTLLIYYLRYLAEKGDFIIIDEPELNLHPNNQVIMARVLSLIQKSGFNLLISTHSDFIVREFNNLILYNSALNKHMYPATEFDKHKKEEIESFLVNNKISKKALINGSEVNAFLFKKGSVNKILIDEEGFSVDTIDDVIQSQANLGFEILNLKNYEEE